jgi:hypothetical protein
MESTKLTDELKQKMFFISSCIFFFLSLFFHSSEIQWYAKQKTSSPLLAAFTEKHYCHSLCPLQNYFQCDYCAFFSNFFVLQFSLFRFTLKLPVDAPASGIVFNIIYLKMPIRYIQLNLDRI